MRPVNDKREMDKDDESKYLSILYNIVREAKTHFTKMSTLICVSPRSIAMYFVMATTFCRAFMSPPQTKKPTIPSLMRLNSSSIRHQKAERTNSNIKDPRTDLKGIAERNQISPSNKGVTMPAKNRSMKPLPRHIAFICDGNSRWAKQTQAQIKQKEAARLKEQKITNKNNNLKENRNTFMGHSKGGARAIALIEHLLERNKHCKVQENNLDSDLEYECENDDKLESVIQIAEDDWSSGSVKYVTMYGFSTENWSRSWEEIRDIWRVMEQTATSFYELSKRERIRVKVLGDFSDERIPQSLKNILQKFTTKDSTEYDDKEEPLTLCIAINYGGRDDILQATRKMAQMVARGEMSPCDIDDDTLSNFLSTGVAGVPDPDLVIRTGGERRLSNFLIWNCAYSELYFTDSLWPDFDENELDLAIDWYQNRERRFGGR